MRNVTSTSPFKMSASNIWRTIYHNVFRRTSTFALSMVVTVFVFERAIDQGSEYVFEKYNKGKLYKDIAPKYAKLRDGE